MFYSFTVEGLGRGPTFLEETVATPIHRHPKWYQSQRAAKNDCAQWMTRNCCSSVRVRNIFGRQP
jgi:hypothetical protein